MVCRARPRRYPLTTARRSAILNVAPGYAPLGIRVAVARQTLDLRQARFESWIPSQQGLALRGLLSFYEPGPPSRRRSTHPLGLTTTARRSPSTSSSTANATYSLTSFRRGSDV